MTTEELREAAQRGLDKIGVKVDDFQVLYRHRRTRV